MSVTTAFRFLAVFFSLILSFAFIEITLWNSKCAIYEIFKRWRRWTTFAAKTSTISALCKYWPNMIPHLNPARILI
jgi:hypothetical protein